MRSDHHHKSVLVHTPGTSRDQGWLMAVENSVGIYAEMLVTDFSQPVDALSAKEQAVQIIREHAACVQVSEQEAMREMAFRWNRSRVEALRNGCKNKVQFYTDMIRVCD